MQVITPTEPPPIHGWEVDEEFCTYFDGQEWVASYRHEEWYEFMGEPAEGRSKVARILAIADLVIKHPREA